MQLKTILNHVEPYKSFVYKKVRWADPETKATIEVLIEPRANSQAICSGCDCRAPGYDHLPARRFEFVPLWQIAVLFVYAPRRVDCAECGVVVERLPWGDGKFRQTKSYRWFLARWAKRLSWQEVAEMFHTSWDSVYRAVRYAVHWGVFHRELRDVVAIGAMSAIDGSGLHIPDDMAVVGFDDIFLAAQIQPALTTVRVPAYGLGWTAAEILITLIRGDERVSSVTLETELVIRESCGIS